MDYIVIKPRGSIKLGDGQKEIEIHRVKDIPSVESFINQQVGKKAVQRRVGDYLFWIADPNTPDELENTVEDIEEGVPDTPELTCNLLINETEFAFGNVVVTANIAVEADKFIGLNEQDVANIQNLFTKTGAYIVEDTYTGEDVAVDSVFDALLSPNGMNFEDFEDIEVDVPEIEDEIPEDYSNSEIEDADPDVFDEIEFGEVEGDSEEWIDIDEVQQEPEEIEFENN